MQASVREKLISALGAAISVLLLGYLLLVGMSVGRDARGEQAMRLLPFRAAPPERPRPPPAADKPRPRRQVARPSPPNLRNKAARIVALPPPIPMPRPSPVIVAPKPGVGMASSAGASDRPGPGEGTGGAGNGEGGGGDGKGGDGGGVPPRLISGRLKFSDLPADLRAAALAGAASTHYTVAVRYRVDVDGRVSGCMATASSGSAELDQLTCRLIEQRFRFKPSRDDDGRPVRSIIEENHVWEIEQQPDPHP